MNNEYLKNLANSLSNNKKTTLMDSVEDSLERLKKDLENTKAPLSVHDQYGNSITAVGTDDKIKSFTSYGFSNDTLNFPLWLCLYNDSWVFRKAIDKPSQDMMRAGITINGESDYDNVYKELNKLKTDLIDLLKWGALFGGSVAIMMFDNFSDEDYARDYNAEKVKQSKYLRLYVTDRWYGVGEDNLHTVTDMSSVDYGKPYSYEITFSDGRTLKVNHSYVLRYEHRTAPRLLKQGALQGWGYAEGSHILNELARDDDLKASITSLLNKSLIEVIKMSGMRGLFMGNDKENEEQIKRRLEMVNWARNYNSLTFLDKDDDYQQNEYSGITGLADLLDTNMKLVSAAIDMPGILFGDLKDGMGNDQDALERYDQVIQDRCEAYLRPLLTKLLAIIYVKLGINEKVDFTFNSLLMKKQADDKLEGIKNFQELLSNMLNDGIINLTQYAKSLQNFSLSGTINFYITDSDLEELKKKEEEESEEFGFEEDEGEDKNEVNGKVF